MEWNRPSWSNFTSPHSEIVEGFRSLIECCTEAFNLSIWQMRNWLETEEMESRWELVSLWIYWKTYLWKIIVIINSHSTHWDLIKGYYKTRLQKQWCYRFQARCKSFPMLEVLNLASVSLRSNPLFLLRKTFANITSEHFETFLVHNQHALFSSLPLLMHHCFPNHHL